MFGALKAGTLPSFGDTSTYFIQSLLNQQLQKQLGDTYRPVTNAFGNYLNRNPPYQLPQ